MTAGKIVTFECGIHANVGACSHVHTMIESRNVKNQ